ncbi:GtrA family protein [Lacticaseibacillus songhuajiangensis]|jgi:putative flippase GtrA|uniref:GtrA family protein n=1 Tax=Lacticaseibacillus songhuajiangensis TaxID=1296539 RepID=UPI000F79F390|nr:GtrA family protein [Lacticaseibacillus songhuajiangensis]MCI1282975.1 GtrA family protein [Lacticaseibacillus songhuajiangensis]
MTTIKQLYQKYAMFIRYVVIGVLTTVVNLVVFFLLKHLGMNYLIANTIAWLVSVIFAFFTNKQIVFQSKSKNAAAFAEMVLFFILRGVSLALDDGLMYLGISVLLWNTGLVKIAVQIIVIITNYIFSKLIFIHPKENR